MLFGSPVRQHKPHTSVVFWFSACYMSHHMKKIEFFSTCSVFLTKCPSHMTLCSWLSLAYCVWRKTLISWVSCILSERADVSNELFLQAWCHVDCDEELQGFFILPWSVNMSSSHLVSCQWQCTCWSISVFPRCLELFLCPSSIIPTSFSSVLAGFSPPLHLECYLRVCQTAKFWSPNFTGLGLLMEVGILLILDSEDPLAINLGQLNTAVQIDFSINLCLTLRTMCFWASPLLFLSGSLLDTSTGVWVMISQAVATTTSRNSGQHPLRFIPCPSSWGYNFGLW